MNFNANNKLAMKVIKLVCELKKAYYLCDRWEAERGSSIYVHTYDGHMKYVATGETAIALCELLFGKCKFRDSHGYPEWTRYGI